MKNIFSVVFVVGALSLVYVVASAQNGGAKPDTTAKMGKTDVKIEKVVKSEQEWRKILTPAQFNVLREKGTERAFTSPLNDVHTAGTFYCAACKLELFSSDNKFDSGTGWPSFYKPIRKGAVIEKRDPDGERSEILCARCEGHLGHVFNDATGMYGIPKTPTGLRYCMNGVAMSFAPKKAAASK